MKERKKKVAKTPEEKRAHRKRGFIVTACVLGVIVLFVAITTSITAIGISSLEKKITVFDKVVYDNQLAPEKDADGDWVFTSDEGLKILQLTDIHIGAGWMSQKKDLWALNAVAAMVTAEKPDLVVVTGDIAYPVPFEAGTFNNKNAAKMFADLMEQLGVYWTFAFGNHDTEIYSYYSRAEISEFYENAGYKYCLYQRGPDNIDGFGNQVIKVKNSKGLYTQALYVLDSHSYVDRDYFGILWKYDNIHQNQIDWYASEVAKINAENAATLDSIDTTGLTVEYYQNVKSLMFFHIPLREYRTAWAEYVNNGNQNNDDVNYIYGVMGESTGVNKVGEETYGVYCGIGHDTLFETMLSLGSTQGIFCGHDHLNDFSVDYKGIRLTYGMSIDYLAYKDIYKKGSQRGCTIIQTAEDGSFTCEASNYYQDKYASKFPKETVTM